MNYKNIRWDRVGFAGVLVTGVLASAAWSIAIIIEEPKKVEPVKSQVSELSDYEKRMNSINECASNLTYETSMDESVAYTTCSNIYDQTKAKHSESEEK